MHRRLVIFTALACLAACGDDAADPGAGSEVDAGVDDPDAQPSVDSGGDDPAPACGREIDPGPEGGNAVAAILDDTYLYVADEIVDPTGTTEVIRVWRYHRERGEGERLAAVAYEGGLALNHRLVVDADSIYVSWDHGEEGGGLLRIPRSGEDTTMITRDGIDSFAVDETHVYWATTHIGVEFEPSIKRRAKAGGDEEILLETNLSFDTQIVLVGDELLFNDDTLFLRRMPKAGGEPAVVGSLTMNCGSPCIDALVAAQDGFLYWSSQSTANVRRMFRSPIDGFERVLIATEPPAVLYRDELFVDGGGLYWRVSEVEARDAGIRRVPVEGGEAVTVLPAWSAGTWVPSSVGLYIVRPYNGVWVVPEDCPE
jgi:hypothetical protein